MTAPLTPPLVNSIPYVVTTRRRTVKWKEVAQRLDAELRQLQGTLLDERDRIAVLSEALANALEAKGMLEVSAGLWQRVAIGLGTVALVECAWLVWR